MAVTPTETVDVPHALDLRRVAEWAGVPVDDIQKLNPEFRRWTTPVKKGEYTIKVPQGTADRVREGLAAAAPGQLNAMQLHTVKRGETLATIARKLQVSRTDLAEANYLRGNVARRGRDRSCSFRACLRRRCSPAHQPASSRAPLKRSSPTC